MLYVDKYRPKSTDSLLLHKDIADNLEKLVEDGDCPHVLFYGPAGAGKNTLAKVLLRRIFGNSVQTIKVQTKPFKIELPSRNIEVELTTASSKYHIEMNPSDLGNNDRYVVQEIIKEMAKNRPVDAEGRKGYKVLVLHEVDRLSKEAQHGLRRTMEKYSSSCRIVMCCTNISKVIEPVRSRCLCVRVAAPSAEEIMQVINHVAAKEKLNLPSPLAARIVEASQRNLRRALLCLEACQVQQYPFHEQQQAQLPDWELYIKEIAADILTEQSPKRLYAVRGKLYELLVNCLPPELIMTQLMKEMVAKVDDELKHDICHWAAFYEHRLQSGSKAIFHLEAFVAKVMALYKQWAISAFS